MRASLRTPALRRDLEPGARGRRGQSLVEFALLVPLIMVMLLGLVEFGFVFAHHQGVEYATREGARTASALSNGVSGQAGALTTCAAIDSGSGTQASVDAQIVAAVQRVLTGKGSLIKLSGVSQIRIWKSDNVGNPVSGKINTWTNTGPNSGPTVDTVKLSFTGPATAAWTACTRSSSFVANDYGGGVKGADIVGVDLTYTYAFTTPLGSMLKWAGASTFPMTDETVMDINP